MVGRRSRPSSESSSSSAMIALLSTLVALHATLCSPCTGVVVLAAPVDEEAVAPAVASAAASGQSQSSSWRRRDNKFLRDGRSRREGYGDSNEFHTAGATGGRGADGIRLGRGRRLASCAKSASLGFHPDTKVAKGCSNSVDYPSQWEREGIKDNMFYPTAEECCAFVAGRTDGVCSVEDVCASERPPPEPAPKPPTARPTTRAAGPSSSCANSATLGFHPDVKVEGGCSNSVDYPLAWEQPRLKDNMFHSTAEECCKFVTGSDDRVCPVEDVCPSERPPTAPEPTPKPPTAKPTAPAPVSGSSCRWHMDMEKVDGCTDDMAYPAEWVGNDAMFRPTAKACCKRFFNNRRCEIYPRGCDGPVPRPPTRRPTPAPTTGRPTSRPTTSPPTREPMLYYIEDLSGMCVSDRQYPKPAWIKKVFFIYDECCQKARDKRLCLQAGGGELGTMPILYYIEDLSGMCVSDRERPKPSWITKVFSIYDECCQKARDERRCLQARPGLGGGELGTMHPTPAPHATYYAYPGTFICVSDSERPIPHWFSGGTYEDYRRCCYLEARDLEKCLEKEPDTSSASSWPTEAPLPVYYLQESMAICVDMNKVSMQWLVDTFEDYAECCETSWDKVKCLAERPTLVPTLEPSFSPSTSWPTGSAICPEPYDGSGSTLYRRDDEVEAGMVIYRCRRPPYAAYCNKADFRPPEEDPGPDIDMTETDGSSAIPVNTIPVNTIGGGQQDAQQDAQLWRDAWERLYRCVHPPSASPSAPPSTPAPTCKTRWHPGKNMNKRICTNSDEYPTLWNVEPLRSTYFVDTAEECCEKFYGGGRCRVRAVC